jgi:hypothetical protein
MNMQGLQKNAYQFYLLVLVNAFVGAMIGLERSVLSGLGEQVFDVSAYTVILSFILAFGFTKALASDCRINYWWINSSTISRKANGEASFENHVHCRRDHGGYLELAHFMELNFLK